jgi:hypothetical protein
MTTPTQKRQAPGARRPSVTLPRPKASAQEIAALLLTESSAEDELTIRIDDEHEFTVVYRPLSWLAKSRCVSAATKYEMSTDSNAQEVNASFRLDVYYKMALKEMIVRSPVPLTDVMIDRLPSRVGEQFNAIIPNPFTDSAMVETLGKDTGSSSTE